MAKSEDPYELAREQSDLSEMRHENYLFGLLEKATSIRAKLFNIKAEVIVKCEDCMVQGELLCTKHRQHESHLWNELDYVEFIAWLGGQELELLPYQFVSAPNIYEDKPFNERIDNLRNWRINWLSRDLLRSQLLNNDNILNWIDLYSRRTDLENVQTRPDFIIEETKDQPFEWNGDLDQLAQLAVFLDRNHWITLPEKGKGGYNYSELGRILSRSFVWRNSNRDEGKGMRWKTLAAEFSTSIQSNEWEDNFKKSFTVKPLDKG